MISIDQAHQLIRKNNMRLRKQLVRVADAVGFVLADEVRTPLELPPFDNSAMDGFVLKSSDTKGASDKKPVVVKIKGEIKAGDSPKRKLRSREAYRIMTGAMVPPGGDTILIKEAAHVEKNDLVIFRPLPKGKHIRYQGEELKKGTRVLRRHSLINPGTIGFLASLGKKHISVFRKPKVSIIATGSELISPGRALGKGKIYDSNSVMIASAVKEMGIEPSWVQTVPDKPSLLRKAIPQALRLTDIVIFMGGVSVGEHDYVKAVLREFGVRTILWKVAQKPGKPLYVGRKQQTLVFGLPGNPASAFTCFYEYVYPALRYLCGFLDPDLPSETAVLQKEVQPDSKRLVFLKGKVASQGQGNGKKVIPLAHQGSHMVSSLHDTNGFILIPPKQRVARKGSKVNIHLLPYPQGVLK